MITYQGSPLTSWFPLPLRQHHTTPPPHSLTCPSSAPLVCSPDPGPRWPLGFGANDLSDSTKYVTLVCSKPLNATKTH